MRDILIKYEEMINAKSFLTSSDDTLIMLPAKAGKLVPLDKAY